MIDLLDSESVAVGSGSAERVIATATAPGTLPGFHDVAPRRFSITTIACLPALRKPIDRDGQQAVEQAKATEGVARTPGADHRAVFQTAHISAVSGCGVHGDEPQRHEQAGDDAQPAVPQVQLAPRSSVAPLHSDFQAARFTQVVLGVGLVDEAGIHLVGEVAQPCTDLQVPVQVVGHGQPVDGV